MTPVTVPTTQVWPPLEVIVYPVITAPPVTGGAAQVTTDWALAFDVPDTPVGAAGAPAMIELEAVEAALVEAPTALLTVTGASNVTGECPPLAQLAELAHAHGARIAVDGANADLGFMQFTASGDFGIAPRRGEPLPAVESNGG